MQLKLSSKFIITFLSLTFVMHEAHEIVHTTIGRIICGCWGERDFNVWGVCESCQNNSLILLATLAGPLFTFIMIWTGFIFLNETKTINQKTFGFSLIFANLPFARVLNPLLGGGDEVVVLNHFINNKDISRIIIVFLIIAITFIPLRKCYTTIQNKNKLGWFLLFYLITVILDIIIVLGIMNTILNQGILSEYWILGSPILVSVWTFLVIIVYLITRKNIYKLSI